MWGIPIVLIGGAYWVYKFIDEKANEEVAQKIGRASCRERV